jgi:two-component system, OmpR family, sensor histidine kinase MprB
MTGRTLPTRLALIAAFTTAISAIAVSSFGYVLARQNVLGEVDASLVRDHHRFESRFARGGGLGLAQEVDGGLVALVSGNGRAIRSTPVGARSFTADDIDVAQGNQPGGFSHRLVDKRRHRFLTMPARTADVIPTRMSRFDPENGGPGLAIVVGRDVESVHDQLHGLAIGFTFLGSFGTVLSALAALVTVRAGTKPLRELAKVVEAIAAGGDAPAPVSLRGPADIAKLNAGMNTMLEALQQSRATQQRMIDDAAHELRTPLTSMQTNLDLLQRADRLDPALRSDITSALMKQFKELRTLVDDLGILADSQSPHIQTPELHRFDFKQVACQSVARAQRRSNSVRWHVDLDSHTVFGNPERLQRAIVNVLDNAVKWSPPNGTISVVLRSGQLDISDEGPGVEVADRHRVFDRFWRASNTRNTPGSGLGLAIVADVVAEHQGQVTLGESKDGGTLVTIKLPRSTTS